MASTSIYKNVRCQCQLNIQCYLHCSFNNYLILTSPIICTTDHQQTLKVIDQLKYLFEIHQHKTIKKEEKSLPSYEDFIVQ
ncbi:unnamed protein product [Rotaria sp. Silwood2]|nr:unnamed protein product [Rotaria sp. Silwood2]CAF4111377.1 unnamed protein product [Rotaria sp. Silwood2]